MRIEIEDRRIAKILLASLRKIKTNDNSLQRAIDGEINYIKFKLKS